MNTIRHFKLEDMVFKNTDVEGAKTTICRAIDAGVSETIGGGLETLDHVTIEWTVTYDEILFIKEGRITIQSGPETYRCAEGDIVWLPKGTSLRYDASDGRCTYFYALYPVDWAVRQGVEEP